MRIVMMTNSYLPQVGGVARSIQRFSRAFRERGHDVLVVCPEFDGAEPEPDVLRVPAVQHFHGSDFALALSVPGQVRRQVEDFDPDIVHAHHPFLLGGAALRLARRMDRPLVFTHHTMYEHYTHYVPGDSAALKQAVVALATSYANLCDMVFAPSTSVAAILRDRGVRSRLRVVPTGVPVEAFGLGRGPALRRVLGIPTTALVVGHVGRLAAEKSLDLLAESLVRVLLRDPRAHVVIAGTGPERPALEHRLAEAAGDGGRVHMLGVLDPPLLAAVYEALDVFLFTSSSETQGMVLVEAMAAGTPVVAVDAPGACDVVCDRHGGRLLPATVVAEEVADAVLGYSFLRPSEITAQRAAAKLRAVDFSLAHTAEAALGAYAEVSAGAHDRRDASADAGWFRMLRGVEAEWELVTELAGTRWRRAAPSAGEVPKS